MVRSPDLLDVAAEGLDRALKAERSIEPGGNLRRSWEALFAGEQPGDQEDLAGRPFVGPAGQLFDAALEKAGIDRSAIYVTNAVKHFKFIQRGKRRIHNKPDAGEIAACRWWIEHERELIQIGRASCRERV